MHVCVSVQAAKTFIDDAQSVWITLSTLNCHNFFRFLSNLMKFVFGSYLVNEVDE